MSDKLLSIVTEGGKEFGFGHITRCISIAKEFQKHNYKIEFIINGDSSVSSLLDSYSYKIFDWALQENELFQQTSDSTIILIDSMKIKDSQLLKLEKTNTPLIFLDDEKRRNTLNKGFVIDWTVLSEEQNYFFPKKKDVVYLLGSQYTPLRKQFQTATQNQINKDIKKIMISFGGADIRDLTPSVLKSITKNFPELEKNIVIGAGFSNIQEIEKLQDENTKLIFNADAQTMIKLMQSNDIAIASGGQTLYELARIGTPTIAILLVENARDDTEGWEKVGSVKNIGWWQDSRLLEKLTLTINSLKDKNTRLAMQKSSQQYINPNGAELLVKRILDNLR